MVRRGRALVAPVNSELLDRLMSGRRVVMKNHQLDTVDIKILTVLQQNGRMTNVDLARIVGLSPSPCLERVKRLEKNGVIRSYGAFLDLDKLGPNITVFAEITLEAHHPRDFTRFETEIQRVPEILDCYQMSGAYDYLLRLVCKDTKAYQEVMERLTNMDLGILKYFGYITLKTVKLASNALPIENLVDKEHTRPATFKSRE